MRPANGLPRRLPPPTPRSTSRSVRFPTAPACPRACGIPPGRYRSACRIDGGASRTRLRSRALSSCPRSSLRKERRAPTPAPPSKTGPPLPPRPPQRPPPAFPPPNAPPPARGAAGRRHLVRRRRGAGEKALPPRRPPPPATRLGGERHRSGVPAAGRLGEGKRGASRSSSDGAEDLFLLGLRPGLDESRHSKAHGGEERARHQRPSGFFEDDDQVEECAHATVLLGYAEGGPAEAGDLPPQSFVIGAVGLHELAHDVLA